MHAWGRSGHDEPPGAATASLQAYVSHAQAASELEAMVQARPLRERRREQLVVAAYRSGRQADALRAYQRCRTVLGDELGLEPVPG